MITTASLKSRTCKDLAIMARKQGVTGWHSMRKDQLVRTLVRLARRKDATLKSKPSPASPRASKGVARKNGSKPVRRGTAGKQNGIKKSRAKSRLGEPSTEPILSKAQLAKNRAVLRKLQKAKAEVERTHDLAAKGITDGHQEGFTRDRIVTMVRGPYWLHVYWEMSRTAVERARVAMGQKWHGSKPILRVIKIKSTSTSNDTEHIYRDIPIHGGVNNWYVDVDEPPCSYRIEIGYLSWEKTFFSIGRSSIITTPKAGNTESVDGHWQSINDNYDRIFSLSGGYSDQTDSTELRSLLEERLRKPVGSPIATQFGLGARALIPRDEEFEFEIDAELIIYGATRPNSHVTLKGEPLRLKPDGTFTIKLNMPDSRQVIPIVAVNEGGGEQRTIILAVQRNTKAMEPVIRDTCG